jgi:hypothetical protein
VSKLAKHHADHGIEHWEEVEWFVAYMNNFEATKFSQSSDAIRFSGVVLVIQQPVVEQTPCLEEVRRRNGTFCPSVLPLLSFSVSLPP